MVAAPQGLASLERSARPSQAAQTCGPKFAGTGTECRSNGTANPLCPPRSAPPCWQHLWHKAAMPNKDPHTVLQGAASGQGDQAPACRNPNWPPVGTPSAGTRSCAGGCSWAAPAAALGSRHCASTGAAALDPRPPPNIEGTPDPATCCWHCTPQPCRAAGGWVGGQACTPPSIGLALLQLQCGWTVRCTVFSHHRCNPSAAAPGGRLQGAHICRRSPPDPSGAAGARTRSSPSCSHRAFASRSFLPFNHRVYNTGAAVLAHGPAGSPPQPASGWPQGPRASAAGAAGTPGCACAQVQVYRCSGGRSPTKERKGRGGGGGD